MRRIDIEKMRNLIQIYGDQVGTAALFIDGKYDETLDLVYRAYDFEDSVFNDDIDWIQELQGQTFGSDDAIKLEINTKNGLYHYFDCYKDSSETLIEQLKTFQKVMVQLGGKYTDVDKIISEFAKSLSI